MTNRSRKLMYSVVTILFMTSLAFTNAQLMPGQTTVGIKGGQDVIEGQLDFLIPVVAYGKNGMMFINPRTTHNNGPESEVNFGIGYRQKLSDKNVILGANVYYDSRWPYEDTHFNQVGAGVELMSDWVDARFNYYLPEDSTELISSREEVSLVSVDTDTDYEVKGKGNDLVETRTTSTTMTYQHDLYELRQGTMEGYDSEIGFKLPLPFDSLEARLFAGYYHFSPNLPTDDVNGMKGRLEVRALPILIFDAEVYEDDRLFDTELILGARVMLPFEIGNIADGRNPFAGIKDMCRKRDKSFNRRMVENVMRDPHIQLSTHTDVETSSSVDEIRESRKRKLNDSDVDIIFVDNKNGTPGGTGAANDPVDTIGGGLVIADDGDTVFVYAGNADYNVPVVVDKDVTLMGQGTPLAADGTRLGSGRYPMVNPAADVAFAVGVGPTLDQVSLLGFNIQADIAGALVQNVTEFDFSYNKVNNTPVGLAYLSDKADDFIVVAEGNKFSNVGAGIAISADSVDGTVAIVNNTMVRCGVGALVANAGVSHVDSMMIGNNIADGGVLDLLSSGTWAALDDFGITLPTDTLPSCIGLLAIAGPGSEQDALIRNNNINGPLLGIGLLSVGGDVDAMIAKNNINGGSLGAGIDLLDDILSLGLPSIDIDLGLAGIAVGSFGSSGEAHAEVIDNNINNSVIGLLGLGLDGSEVTVLAALNRFAGNIIGVGGAAISEAHVHMGIFANRIIGGGLQEVIEGLVGSPAPFKIHDAGLAGIAGIAVGEDSVFEMMAEHNYIAGHAVGVLGLNLDDALWYGEVYDNYISGGGGRLLLEVLSSGDETLPRDVGLAGVLVLDLYGNDTYCDVWDNDIDSHIIGVGMLAAGSNLSGNEDCLWVDDNRITDSMFGVGVIASEDAWLVTDIENNNISGAPNLGLGAIPLGAGVVTIAEDATVDAKIATNVVTKGAGFGIWGINGEAGSTGNNDLNMVVEDNTITKNGTLGMVLESHGTATLDLDAFNNNTVVNNDRSGIINDAATALGLPSKFFTSVGLALQNDASKIKVTQPMTGNTIDGKILVYEDVGGNVSGVPGVVRQNVPGYIPLIPWWPTFP